MASDSSKERVMHAVLERQAAKYGSRTFLYFGDDEFSFEDIERSACRAARGFQGLGIAKGDKVAVMMDNCPEFIFSMFGLSKLGAVQVPINIAHKGDLLTNMLDGSDTTTIVVGGPYLDRVERVLANTPKVQTVILLDSGEGASGEREETRERITNMGRRVVDWAQVIDNDGTYQPAEVLWSDPFIIMYTSGTTGPSKGALLPHNLPFRTMEMLCEAGGFDENDCFYNALPLFHSSGQLMSTTAALLSGARMVMIERFSPSRFWEDVKRYGCTQFTYVGSMLAMLFKAEPRPDDAENSLRVMLGGGAPGNIFEAFEKRFGVTLVEVYGMSEIGLPLNATVKDRRPGTCGKPHSDFVAKIVDDDGLEVGHNTPGELLIRPLKPYCLQLEYHKMPQKTVEAWRDLWFHTGDYLCYDEDGYFYFVDRKKDALRRRGENISSYEVEKTINSHPAVLESAAVAVKSEVGEDEVMVCLTLKPWESLAPLELIAYCEERMAYFMVPRYLRFLEALPKTPTQRTEKYRLRDAGITPDTWDREKAGYKLKR